LIFHELWVITGSLAIPCFDLFWYFSSHPLRPHLTQDLEGELVKESCRTRLEPVC